MFIAAQCLTKNEKAGVDKIFKCLDSNGDGQIDKQDVKDGYAEYFGKYLSDREVKEIFDKIDVDRSGLIDYSEFLVAAMPQ